MSRYGLRNAYGSYFRYYQQNRRRRRHGAELEGLEGYALPIDQLPLFHTVGCHIEKITLRTGFVGAGCGPLVGQVHRTSGGAMGMVATDAVRERGVCSAQEQRSLCLRYPK